MLILFVLLVFIFNAVNSTVPCKNQDKYLISCGFNHLKWFTSQLILQYEKWNRGVFIREDIKITDSQNTIYREICCLLSPMFPLLHWSRKRQIKKNEDRSQFAAISQNEKQRKYEEKKNSKSFLFPFTNSSFVECSAFCQ